MIELLLTFEDGTSIKRDMPIDFPTLELRLRLQCLVAEAGMVSAEILAVRP